MITTIRTLEAAAAPVTAVSLAPAGAPAFTGEDKALSRATKRIEQGK